MAKPILVIMAAGLGSRFGGFKQVSCVDDAGHFIIDFSVYDAIAAGFGEVVFVVKPEHEAVFHETIGARVMNRVPVHYAHQKLDQLPSGFRVPDGREKPWGTAHAVLSAKRYINGPFAVINADDFYGRDAFKSAARFLMTPHAASEHAMVGYHIENTLTEHGYVARGVCSVKDGRLSGIVERTHIEPCEGGARYTEDGGENWTFLSGDTIVSMNLWAFGPSIIGEIEARFETWLQENLAVNPLACEYYLPLVPNQLVREGAASVEVLKTNARWYGVTYQADLPRVKAAILSFEAEGLYPERLF